MTHLNLWSLAGAIASGTLFGVLFFGALRSEARRLVTGQTGLALARGLRGLVGFGFFALFAKSGAANLLGALMGMHLGGMFIFLQRKGWI